MSSLAKTRRIDIDFLKGLSIIAVVLYHLGLLESGYLGVDVFFVIAGFLTAPRVLKEICNKQFNYIKFIWGKVIRLLPLVLIGSVLCLLIGYFLWLPDDYENLSQSVIASTAFSNNILSAITTKNYWDSVNDYKPLMHTWYLGILMEFYIVLPILTFILVKFSKLVNKDAKTTVMIGFTAISIISVILFLLPQVSTGDKFYLLPFRLFELLIGCSLALNIEKIEKNCAKYGKPLSVISLGVIVFALISGVFTFDFSNLGVETVVIGQKAVESTLILSNQTLVLLATCFTVLFLSEGKNNEWINKDKLISTIGKRSFSIFVWHQILLALYRYSISSKITLPMVIGFLAVTIILSELSYRFIELKIEPKVKTTIATILLAGLICGYSGIIYLKAGVVRDVPELNINTETTHRGMHAEYCDRIYSYNKDFESTDKIKVLIIGNSFARDFANILLESDYSNKVEISYTFNFDETPENRVSEADKIFVFSEKTEVPEFIWKTAESEDIVYGIGTKNFGTLNGQIYFNRFSNDYFEQTIPLDDGYKAFNDKLKAQWGDHYIDMIEVVCENNQVNVFTDKNMYISQDTRHLTQAGAEYYSDLLDIKNILY